MQDLALSFKVAEKDVRRELDVAKHKKSEKKLVTLMRFFKL